MFHVEHETDRLDVIGEGLGLELDDAQKVALLRFEAWLAEEAIPAGGIGPGEGERLFDRHIADSMAFNVGISQDVDTAIDVGGGVGLPSIPLAILRPDVEFTLVERSRRRSDLAARAVRILGLTNYAVVAEDVSRVDLRYDVALFRASLPIPQAAASLEHCLKPKGTGLLAVSRQWDQPDIPSAPEGITFALSREGDRILASPFWLLTMRYS